MESEEQAAFAVWITGLPGAGKSTLAAAIRRELARQGITAAVLESDEMRRILTPQPVYDEAERDAFYKQLASLGALLARQGVCVIFDATAHRRAYRERARGQISRFLEVYVDCPLAVCMERDPKGIYRKGRIAKGGTVPGLQAEYEPPWNADVVVSCQEAPTVAAGRILSRLEDLEWLPGAPATGAI